MIEMREVVREGTGVTERGVEVQAADMNESETRGLEILYCGRRDGCMMLSSQLVESTGKVHQRLGCLIGNATYVSNAHAELHDAHRRLSNHQEIVRQL